MCFGVSAVDAVILPGSVELLDVRAVDVWTLLGAIGCLTDTELAMLTRSMLSIMRELRAPVDVPPEDITEGRAQPTMPILPEGSRELRMYVDIRSSLEDAFVSVTYRDRWFWIDDRDFASKRTFSFLMPLFSLTETGGKEGLPLVTIPTG